MTGLLEPAAETMAPMTRTAASVIGLLSGSGDRCWSDVSIDCTANTSDQNGVFGHLTASTCGQNDSFGYWTSGTGR